MDTTGILRPDELPFEVPYDLEPRDKRVAGRLGERRGDEPRLLPQRGAGIGAERQRGE